MTIIGVGQGLIFWVLSVAALGLEGWSCVEALRFRKDAYPAAGKQTKVLWVSITVVATLVGFLALPGGPLTILSFLSLLAVAGAVVFLVSARPALRTVQGRRSGGTSSGPYGGW